MEEDKKCDGCSECDCAEELCETCDGEPTECTCDEECQEVNCEDCAADAAEWKALREEYAERDRKGARFQKVLAWLYVAAIVSCGAAIIVQLTTYL